MKINDLTELGNNVLLAAKKFTDAHGTHGKFDSTELNIDISYEILCIILRSLSVEYITPIRGDYDYIITASGLNLIDKLNTQL